MSVLLKFLFSEENLAKWLRPEWLKLYDPAFVDEELIGKVLVFVPQVQSLQVVLEGNMAKEAAKKEAAAEAAKALAEGRGGSGVHTTPEPFNLTRPNMRLVPPPAPCSGRHCGASQDESLLVPVLRLAGGWPAPEHPWRYL